MHRVQVTRYPLEVKQRISALARGLAYDLQQFREFKTIPLPSFQQQGSDAAKARLETEFSRLKDIAYKMGSMQSAFEGVFDLVQGDMVRPFSEGSEQIEDAIKRLRQQDLQKFEADLRKVQNEIEADMRVRGR
jgi:hypothetical protein